MIPTSAPQRYLPTLLFIGLLLVASGVLAERPEPTVHGVFDGDEMYTVLGPDAIPAIQDPEYVTGEAAAAQMSPEEHVMGLAEGEAAMCWSTWQLDSHEIVNTEFKGSAIAAAW